jgi:hypothetical protein
VKTVRNSESIERSRENSERSGQKTMAAAKSAKAERQGGKPIMATEKAMKAEREGEQWLQNRGTLRGKSGKAARKPRVARPGVKWRAGWQAPAVRAQTTRPPL